MSIMEVVGLGALNMDYLYQVELILDDGEAVVNDISRCPGGSAANTIYGLAKLGLKTGFAGVVGDDEDGELLIQDFQKVGVDTSQIKIKPRAKTGMVVCLSDRSGKRSLYVLPGVNSQLTVDDLNLSYLNQAKVLHIASFADDRQFEISRDLIKRLDSSVKVSFAPGMLYAAKGMNALAPILRRTYVLFINRDEIRQLTGKSVKAGAESCLKLGCQIVVVTLGKGIKLRAGKQTGRKTITAIAYIRDAENEYIIEPTSENTKPALNTTGVGDAFAAGFLYGLIKGADHILYGLLGDITARLVTTKMGARTGLPTIKELSQHYQEIYKRKLTIS